MAQQETERLAWVTLADTETMRQSAAPGRPSPYNFGFMPGMARLRMAHSRIGTAMSALFWEVMVAPSHLSRAEREMVAAVTAAAQDCHY